MALAYGMGPGLGFGLGFLNFLGTILFFAVVLFAIRAFVVRGRGPWRGRHAHAGTSDGDGPSDWRDWRPWSEPSAGSGAASADATPEASDEAMDVARQRLAEGEIDPEAFRAIRDGLEHSRGRHDDAVRTLRLRLARSEIDRDAFDAALTALG